MITIKDLEDKGKWLTPAERRKWLIDRKMHALNMPFPSADEYRVHITLGAIQYFDKDNSLVKDKEQIRKEIEHSAKLLVLRKLYGGIHDRHGRIMELKETFLRECRFVNFNELEKAFSPITEILNIVNGRS